MSEEITINITVANYIKQGIGETIFKAKSNEYRKMPNPYILDFFVHGYIPTVNTGDTLTLRGKFISNTNFQMTSFIKRVESGKNNHIKVLTKARGVGPAIATKIVENSYPNTFEKILEEGFLEGLGIKSKIITRLKEEALSYVDFAEIQLFLNEYYIEFNDIYRLYNRFKDKTIEKCKENPYILLDELYLDFTRVDSIAQKNYAFIPEDFRLQGAILSCIRQMVKSYGHTFVYESSIRKNLSKYLKVYSASNNKALTYEGREAYLDMKITEVLESLATTRKIVITRNKEVYLSYLFNLQNKVVRELKQKTSKIKGSFSKKQDKDLDKFLESSPLSDNQKEAIRNALKYKLSIVTGGPGTGKTFTLTYLLKVLSKYKPKKTVQLLAPTGRAAQQMATVTNCFAETIHKALGLSQYFDSYKESLEGDYIVIDESSMIDLKLFLCILESLKEGSHLILLGDANQINSVSAGNVFKDLIDSEKIPVTRLDLIFRQSQKSLIISNSHKIISKEKARDLECDDKFEIKDSTILTEFKRLVDKSVPISDIQVLTSMNKGDLGTWTLNPLIKAYINPQPIIAEIGLGEDVSLGDRVMQTVNDYDLDVFNGDIGHIVNYDDKYLYIEFPNKDIKYPREKLNYLTLAYAITIHKSQGSEFPSVLIAVDYNFVFNRQLLYTGVTRAKNRVVLVGNNKIYDELDKIIEKEGANRNSTLAKSF